MSLKRAASYGIAEIGAKGTAWLAILVCGYLLPADQFAVIVLALGFEALAIGAGVFGQDKLILLSKDNQSQILHFQAGMGFILLMSFSLLILIFPVSYVWYSVSFDTVSQSVALILLCALAAGFRLLSAMLRAQDIHLYFLASRAVFGIGRFLFVAIALFLEPSAVSVIVAMSLAYIMPIVLASCSISFNNEVRQQTTALTFITTLRKGTPFFGHMVSANFIAFGDRYVLAIFVDKYILAAYGFWHAVVSATQFIYVALSSYFEKQIYREVALGNNYTRDLFFFCSLAIVSFIGFSLISFIYIFHTESTFLKYTEVINLIPAFLLTAILQSFYFTICYSIIAYSRSDAIGRSAVFAIVINILLLFIFGHISGANGIAFAKILAVIFVMVMLIYQSKLTLSQVLPITKNIWAISFLLIFIVVGSLSKNVWADYLFVLGLFVIFSLSSFSISKSIQAGSS